MGYIDSAEFQERAVNLCLAEMCVKIYTDI
jgi:hypothetical protein